MMFAGHLRLTAARREDGATYIAEQSFRAPFHISKPYWDGRVLHVQVVNPTAGILSGDRMELDVRATRGASLRVSTPAATRAFMMTRGVACCRQQFTVEAGAALEYAPEPLCPHRGCDYSQVTRIDVAADADLCFTDTLAPGRVGRGERWAWRHLRLALDVRLDGEPVLRETLDGSGDELARAASFHGTPDGWLLTAIVMSPRLAPDSAAWELVRACHRDGTWAGVSRLRRSGWIFRAIAPDGQAARDLLAEFRTALSAHLPILRSDTRRV